MTNHYADVCEATIESLRQTVERQAAQIEMMQDALKEVQMVAESSVKTHGYDKHHVRNSDVAKRALATTHNDALQTFAAKVREQCAHIIEAQDVDPSFKHRMADAIRSLKELPK